MCKNYWDKTIILLVLCSSSLALLDPLAVIAQSTKKLKRFQEASKSLYGEYVYASKKPTRSHYDFIVVGSSPSGCVITNRLSEDPSTTVLLLEAGKEDNVITDIPILNPFILLSDYSWAYETELADNACLGMTGQRCPWPSGKGPGGGTILNAMIWTRGNFRDYDSWAAEGNPGWSYNDILPLFLRMEKTMIPHLMNSPFHGKNGSLNIEYAPFTTPLLRAFIEAGKRFGFKEVDYNNPKSHIGFAQIQATVRNGERMSAASAFLKPIFGRGNFQMSLVSRVTKILIDPTTMRATGVVYIRRGKEYTVYANKEVIISAGAFGSPQLLMLSGIGPAYHLNDLGIQVLVDLPVGDNLMEHPGMHGLTFLTNKKVGLSVLRIIDNIIPNAINYVVKSQGELTSLGCEGISFMKTKYSNSTEDYPDLEILFVATGMNTDGGLLLRKTFGISDELYETTYKPFDNQEGFMMWPMLLYPQSRGYVRLKDANPFSKVRIHHNFLRADIDLKILVEGLKIAVMLSKSPSFQQYGAKLIKIPFPGCEILEFGSDKYWECAVKTMTTQFHHQSGTCKMGTVVNHKLQVFGVSGLRVADASIMPTIVGGHTQAAAYLIGEKAADLIKNDWNMV